MNFDFGEVLSRAWQITWKHKELWIIGILLGFFISTMFPLMLSPFLLLPRLIQNSQTPLMVGLIIGGYIIAFLLFMLALYPISALTQTAVTLGILDVDQDNEHFSAGELIKRSLPFFWRVLGLMLLFAVGINLIILIIQTIIFLLTIVTLGMAAFCLMPLMVFMYPALYVAIVWMEQAVNGIIVDNMTAMEAASQAWNLVRNNLLSVVLMALVIYLGIGFVTGIVMLPMMISLFIVPFSFMENEPNWTILSISILCTVAFISLFALISGWSMIFTKAAWILTYLRMTRSPKLQPLLQAAAA